jgi:hypothetical protein
MPVPTAVLAPIPVPTPAPVPVSTPASAPAPASDGIDRSEWSESLAEAHAYLSGKKWGPRWTALLDALVKHEWSFYHPEEDGKLPKLRSRPGAYEQWMKEHRPMQDYEIPDDFGDDLFDWWKELGPPARWENVGDGGQQKEPSRAPSDVWPLYWTKLHKRGRNGPVLFVLGLAWWGQKICNAAAGDGLGAEDAALAANLVWQLMVDDVGWVMADILTQDRIGMESWDAEKEQERREEAEAEKEEEERAAATKKTAAQNDKGKKAPGKAKKSAPAKQKTVMKEPATKKR